MITLLISSCSSSCTWDPPAEEDENPSHIAHLSPLIMLEQFGQYILLGAEEEEEVAGVGTSCN